MVHGASKFRSRSERPSNFRVKSLLKAFCQFGPAGTRSAATRLTFQASSNCATMTPWHCTSKANTVVIGYQQKRISKASLPLSLLPRKTFLCLMSHAVVNDSSFFFSSFMKVLLWLLQVIKDCCCYLKVIKQDLSTFNSSWELPNDMKLSNLFNESGCERDKITFCFDSNSKF